MELQGVLGAALAQLSTLVTGNEEAEAALSFIQRVAI